MKYVKATVVVTSAVAVNLRKLSQMLERSETDGMFTTGLSATGAAPATHFVSTGWMPRGYLQLLADDVALFQRAQQAYADEGATFPFTQAQVTNALSKCSRNQQGQDGAEDETCAAMLARLGLQMIQEAP